MKIHRCKTINRTPIVVPMGVIVVPVSVVVVPVAVLFVAVGVAAVATVAVGDAERASQQKQLRHRSSRGAAGGARRQACVRVARNEPRKPSCQTC